MIELRHFRYFIAVAEELHFGRAAERLFMTQPPLSMQIKQLEETVGAALFVRGSRPIELTAAGEMLLIHARSTIKQADIAIQKARLTSRGEAGNLTIAVTSASVLSLLPRLIASFRQRYPEVLIHIKEMVSRNQLNALKQSDINFGLIRLPTEYPSIESILIQLEPIVVAIPRKHKYADLDKISVNTLHQTPFISFDPENAAYFHKLASDLFSTHGVTPLIVQSATQLHTVLALVAAGFGLALVPKAASRIQLEDVVLRPLDVTPTLSAELHLAWNSNDTNPAINSFIELVRKEWPIKDITTTW